MSAADPSRGQLAPARTSPGAARARLAGAVSLAAAGALTLLVLLLALGPIATDDLWFHLAAGRTYAAEGPWPAGDPLLHTAHAAAPVQHEWLFGLAVHGLERALGLRGLRAAHALLVLGIAGLAASLFRRAAGSVPAAALATAAFLALSWWRLAQLRPDLVSIPATLLAYRLLLEGGGAPSWGRVAAFAALLVPWANAHSLFAVALLLLAAALAGLALAAGLARRAGGDPEARGLAARRLAAALGLGALAAALNPRGFAQHVTFATSTRGSALWRIPDEWAPFDPLALGGFGPAGSVLDWLLTNALLAAFAGLALWRGGRLARRPSPAGLRALDPVGLALGLAGAAALLASIRFRWLAFLPLLYLLRGAAAGLARPRGAWACAAASLALLAAFPTLGGYRRAAALLPARPAEYLARPYVAGKYHAEGVRFLAETGLEGRLFNHYWLGGFLGYWLAPRLRTFVDGRVEHYPPEVLDETAALAVRRGARPGEGFLELLDRRGVDLFFGIGLPPSGAGPWAGVYSAGHLEGVAGWLLVFRSVDQALYLRDDPRNAANRERVAAYYRERGIAFDPRRGLDVEAAIRARPDWATAVRLLPRDHGALLDAARSADPGARLRALDALGAAYAAVGAFGPAVEADRAAAALRPSAKAPRRRLVWASLRTGRRAEAQRAARQLLGVDPVDPRSRRIAAIAQRYADATVPRAEREALLVGFPLLDPPEKQELLDRFRLDFREGAEIGAPGPRPQPISSRSCSAPPRWK